VDNVAGVTIGHGTQELMHDFGRLTLPEVLAFDDGIEEFAPGYEPEDDTANSLAHHAVPVHIIRELEDLDDIWMVLSLKQRRTRLRKISISPLSSDSVSFDTPFFEIHLIARTSLLLTFVPLYTTPYAPMSQHSLLPSPNFRSIL
jgi:hypothetical protein